MPINLIAIPQPTADGPSLTADRRNDPPSQLFDHPTDVPLPGLEFLGRVHLPTLSRSIDRCAVDDRDPHLVTHAEGTPLPFHVLFARVDQSTDPKIQNFAPRRAVVPPITIASRPDLVLSL